METLHAIKQWPRFALFLKHMRWYARNTILNVDQHGHPTLSYNGVLFTGFLTTGDDLSSYRLFRRFLPHNLPSSHYRLLRDFITRYVYPHMMPTASPSTFLPSYFLSGFHGQHKDAISQIKDKGLRRHIHAAFEIQPHDVIINGGAYLGFGDLRIAPLNFEGRILAIEAAKHCFDLLQQNISSNGAGNVLPIHCALWNVRELRSLGVSSFQANTLVPRETRTRASAEVVNATQFETIEAIPIDDLVDLYAVARVDFANLTLNGAEVEAVEGMKDTLSQYKHRLRLAGWYVRARPIRKICQTFLNKFSYRVIVGGRGNVFGLPKQFLKLLLITTLSQPPTFLISVQ